VTDAEARALLARAGLDCAALEADGAAAADRLLPHVADAALVDALATVAGPGIAALLAAVEPRVTERGAHKAIRRALYRIRQRGVAVTEPPRVATPIRAAGGDVEGFVTGFGGDGDRILWLLKALRDGGLVLVSAHVHDARGLVEVGAGELTRKKVREMRQRMEAGGRVRLVPADWRTVDALLIEAEAKAGATEPKRSYARIRPRITTEPPRPAAEPVSARVASAAADEAAALVAGSAELFAVPEIATWMPALAELAPFVEELGAAHESPLVVSRGAQEERVRAVVRRAAATLAPPERMARRLEGTAYVLAETGRGEAARQALAVAAALRARPEQAADVPFVVAFVERPLGELLARTTKAAEREPGSLVVTPAEFLKDRSSTHPSRTRG
jgi:hypothetical protein